MCDKYNSSFYLVTKYWHDFSSRVIFNRIPIFPRNLQIFSSGNTPKAAIIVNPLKLNVMPLLEFTSDKIVCVKALIKHIEVMIISIYAPSEQG